MLQLTQRGPPELRSNSRRMQSILQARTWDAQLIFDFGTSCCLMPYGQGGPPGVGTRVHFVNSVGHEMVSLPAPVPLRDIRSAKTKSLLPKARVMHTYRRDGRRGYSVVNERRPAGAFEGDKKRIPQRVRVHVSRRTHSTVCEFTCRALKSRNLSVIQSLAV